MTIWSVILVLVAAAGSGAPSDRGVTLVGGKRLDAHVLGTTGTAVRVRIGDREFDLPGRILKSTPVDVPSLPRSPAEPSALVHLRDGGIVPGRILSDSGASVVVEAAGRRIVIPESHVVDVEGGGPHALSDAERALATDALSRLGASDPVVRRSALEVLTAFGPTVRPLVIRTALQPGLPGLERSALLMLLVNRRRMGRAGNPLYGDPDTSLAILTLRLGLTRSQQEKTRKVLAKELKALHSSGSSSSAGSGPAGGTSLRAVASRVEKALIPILTDVQAKKLQSLLRTTAPRPRRKR